MSLIKPKEMYVLHLFKRHILPVPLDKLLYSQKKDSKTIHRFYFLRENIAYLNLNKLYFVL